MTCTIVNPSLARSPPLAGQCRPSGIPSAAPRHVAPNFGKKSRRCVPRLLHCPFFQDSGPLDDVSEEEGEEEEGAEEAARFFFFGGGGGAGVDPRRDGRFHAGHRQRDGLRRRRLHLRAGQRQEPLGRRPRR